MGHTCIRAGAALAVLLVSEILCSTLLLTLLGSVRVGETGISIASWKGTWKAEHMGKGDSACHYSGGYRPGSEEDEVEDTSFYKNHAISLIQRKVLYRAESDPFSTCDHETIMKTKAQAGASQTSPLAEKHNLER